MAKLLKTADKARGRRGMAMGDVMKLANYVGEHYGLLPAYAIIISMGAFIAASRKHLLFVLSIMAGVYVVMFQSFNLQAKLLPFDLSVLLAGHELPFGRNHGSRQQDCRPHLCLCHRICRIQPKAPCRPERSMTAAGTPNGTGPRRWPWTVRWCCRSIFYGRITFAWETWPERQPWQQ